MKQRRSTVAAALLAAVAALVAPAVADAKQPPVDPLMPAVVKSLHDGKAVLVLFHAEWCEPCNELDAQVFEHQRGAALRQRVHVVHYELDSPLGQAAAQTFSVLTLPTALVVRPIAAEGPSGRPLGWREIERIEGFEDASSWIATVDAALRRDPKTPRAVCTAWKGKAGPGHFELLPCATSALRDLLEGGGAAGWIEQRVTGAVPPGARRAALDASRALQRYWLRVRHDPARCADVAARTKHLAAGDPDARAGLAYWHALCLKRAGQTPRALAVLEEHVTSAGHGTGRVAAHLLAADLLVHERIEPARARSLLQVAIKEDPRNDEALYLFARLMRDLKRPDQARALVARARALAPHKALYRHFEEGLGKKR